MRSTVMSFNIEKCTSNDCYSSDVIDDYVKDLELNVWAINSKINFTDRVTLPAFRVQDMYHSTILNTSQEVVVRRPYIYLRKNLIETEDNIVYPFSKDFSGTFYDVGRAIERPLTKYGDNE